MAQIEQDGKAAGILLRRGGNPMVTNDNPANLKNNLGRMLAGGARVVLVMLHSDSYGIVKYVL